jgi:beta-lactam-binding protein with PASTA domain
MRGSIVVGWALAWGAAAWAQGDQIDIRNNAQASLRSALAGAPKSRDAAY